MVWNPVTEISEMTSDGWYWDGLLRFEDRPTAEKQKEHMLKHLAEVKVIKRGGSKDPHFRVVYKEN